MKPRVLYKESIITPDNREGYEHSVLLVIYPIDEHGNRIAILNMVAGERDFDHLRNIIRERQLLDLDYSTSEAELIRKAITDFDTFRSKTAV